MAFTKSKEDVHQQLHICYELAEKKLLESGLTDPSRLALPDFLIIGMPKAGTWWLAHNLACHEEIFLATGKQRGELHYFDEHFHKRLATYTRYFSGMEPHQIGGEKTPNYCCLPVKRIRFIKAIMPSVKLILILRNPIERAWSHAMMDLVRTTGKVLAEVSQERLYRHLYKQSTLYDYKKIIQNWSSYFGPEQLFIGYFNHISSQPQTLLENIFNHLAVNSKVDWSEFPYQRQFNKGPGVVMPTKYRNYLAKLYEPIIEELYAYFPSPEIQEWQSQSQAHNIKY